VTYYNRYLNGYRMATVSLEDLVHTLAGSILRAQNLVEQSQLGNLTSYFNENKQPLTADLQLPSMNPRAAPGTFDTYRLPLLTLVPHSSLVISEAQIDMDVDIGSVQGPATPPEASALGATAPDVPSAAATPQGAQAAQARRMFGAMAVAPRPALMVDPGAGGIAKQAGNAAHITIKLTSTDNTEGVARLLNDVIKIQGISGTAGPGPEPQTPGGNT
jgi:hypothetical protein